MLDFLRVILHTVIYLCLIEGSREIVQVLEGNPKFGWARDSHVFAAPSRGRCGAAGAAARAGRLTKGGVRERCDRVSDGAGRAACCAAALSQPGAPRQGALSAMGLAPL